MDDLDVPPLEASDAAALTDDAATVAQLRALAATLGLPADHPNPAKLLAVRRLLWATALCSPPRQAIADTLESANTEPDKVRLAGAAAHGHTLSRCVSLGHLHAARGGAAWPVCSRYGRSVCFYVSFFFLPTHAPDPVVADAAKVLRLLHLAELRALQAKASALIVAFQRITANPRTDASLGKVGV